MARDGEEAWPWVVRDGEAGPEPEATAEDETAEQREERERLEAARRYFRAAPAYCIRFERDGRVSLRHKHLSTWGKTRPADATLWKVISYHADLEEAERRLRHIASPTVYYDERGQVAAGLPKR